jgi:capsule polysaccharide export protein KpsE/RkpR
LVVEPPGLVLQLPNRFHGLDAAAATQADLITDLQNRAIELNQDILQLQNKEFQSNRQIMELQNDMNELKSFVKTLLQSTKITDDSSTTCTSASSGGTK